MGSQVTAVGRSTVAHRWAAGGGGQRGDDGGQVNGGAQVGGSAQL
jgi:hypothetical protein